MVLHGERPQVKGRGQWVMDHPSGKAGPLLGKFPIWLGRFDGCDKHVIPDSKQLLNGLHDFDLKEGRLDSSIKNPTFLQCPALFKRS